ncbi:GerAB/ArcD/ProY family transporter [Clostridium sp. WILCCON 0269]|uniref:GerAB/ArcD/ProY family transporter n=1 Tax=Candidatus Clostridium eludens TaxID=3381663 RepID=A0ABW8SLF4_9CLOT
MNKTQNTFLTSSQLIFILKSAIVGIELMHLPNSIIKFAKQDSWISCILATVYPLYMVIMASYLCKKFPKDNILKLSKKCFGNFLGSILNIIFISFFLFVLTSSFSEYANLFRVYSTSFLKPYQILLAALIPIGYIAYKGIKPLGRLAEVGFYLTVGLVVIPIAVLAYGSFLNLMPVFGSGLSGILKGSRETAFAISGMEIILIIYPFLQDNKKLLKCGIVATAIVGFIYVWAVFATIYYLGIETSPKYLWPILTLADSINIPIVNSFRFIFISLWSLVEFKCLAIYYFAVSYSLNQTVKKIPAEAFVVILYPVIIIITMLYGNPTTRGGYTYKLIIVYVIFNLIYVSAVAILIHFKKHGADKSNSHVSSDS